jgi:CRP-like cAMP-binding protein
MHQYPQLAINSLSILATRIQEFQDRFREIATERVERRIARALLRLASQTGRKLEHGILIDISLTRQDLAEMTGTTLYTVSRTLSQWEKDGLVSSQREQVTILSPHKLVVLAEDMSR